MEAYTPYSLVRSGGFHAGQARVAITHLSLCMARRGFDIWAVSPHNQDMAVFSHDSGGTGAGLKKKHGFFARAATHAPGATPAVKARAATRAGKKTSPHGLRIGAIDIGTNSLHLVVVEVTEQLGFRILSSEKELTRLGYGALVRHEIPQRAMTHTLEVLGRYQQIARGLECNRILAYATSAVRESKNGGDFVQAAKERLGLDVRVISSQEEARLIYLAVRQAVDLDEQRSLIVDIGGGSAEFIVGTAHQALLLESYKVGASRLSQQFITSDPASGRDMDALEKHIKKALKPVMKKIEALDVQRIIGTSGTMENLAAMCVQQHGEAEVRRRRPTEMLSDDFALIYKKLQRLPVAGRRAIPGLDPGRADQILGGAAVVAYVFDRLQVDRVEISDRAMREGMIIDYMQTHWPRVRLSVQVREPRRRSVIELGRRCNYNEAHHQQVAGLALALFDQLKDVHGLDQSRREQLEFAALLHDIGWHIGHSGHHKHSYYLVKNGDLEGFSPLELEMIANVARYHRRSMPKKSHAAYMSLAPAERNVVDRMAALLRIADGLDRGHYGNVQNIKVRVRKGNVAFVLETKADPELELWAARHKTDLFEAVFKRTASFTARPAKA